MDYQEFMKLIYEQVKRNLPEHLKSAEMEFTTIKSLNGTDVNGAVIKTEQDVVAPQFYMDRYFDDYQNGRSLEDIAREMVTAYLAKENMQTSDLYSKTRDYNVIREMLAIQLINKEDNAELLKHIPHKDLENTNLTASIRVKTAESKEGVHSYQVKNHMLDLWNVSPDTLYQDALANCLKKEKPIFFDIRSKIFNMFGADAEEEREPDNMRVEPYQMCVLSNASSHWGAATLLYPDLLDKIAQNSESNLFIIPSSIHETIVICDTGEMNAEDLQAMVININHQEVLPEEVLSNEVYYYDKDEHSLSQTTSREKTKELLERITDRGHDNQAERDELLER